MAKKQASPPPKQQAKVPTNDSQSVGIPPIAKQILLLFLSGALLFSFLKLPKNELWMQKIAGYYKEIKDTKKILTPEERLQQRHGGNYMLPKFIAEKAKPTDILLLPPKEYVQKYENNPNNWSNPYVFYYMNNKVKTVPFAADSLRATTTMTVTYNAKGQPSLVTFPNDSTRKAIIQQMDMEAKAFQAQQNKAKK
jgi:hypothetical protein